MDDQIRWLMAGIERHLSLGDIDAAVTWFVTWLTLLITGTH